MKRRIKTIIGLACGALLCAGLAACTRAETELDKKEKENYIVGVVYDPNGGKFDVLHGERSPVLGKSHWGPEKRGRSARRKKSERIFRRRKAVKRG